MSNHIQPLFDYLKHFHWNILDYNYLRHREALLHMKATPTSHHLDNLEGGVPAFPPSLLRSLPSSLPFLPASEQRMCLGVWESKASGEVGMHPLSSSYSLLSASLLIALSGDTEQALWAGQSLSGRTVDGGTTSLNVRRRHEWPRQSWRYTSFLFVCNDDMHYASVCL